MIFFKNYLVIQNFLSVTNKQVQKIYLNYYLKIININNDFLYVYVSKIEINDNKKRY